MASLTKLNAAIMFPWSVMAIAGMFNALALCTKAGTSEVACRMENWVCTCKWENEIPAISAISARRACWITSLAAVF